MSQPTQRLTALVTAVLATLTMIVATAAAIAAATAATGTTAPPVPAPPAAAVQPAPGPVRHIVVFKYKPTATPAQIQEVTKAFAALQTSIPGITAFEHGVNNSPEKKNLGFTHAYVVTFTDAAARDAYLPHPEHRKFGELLGRLGVLEDAFVVDYVPQS